MSSYLWPRPLRPGGVIGICSPAGAAPAGEVERGAAALRRRGYTVIVAPNATATHPECNYLAGTEVQRLADLNELIHNPEIDCILTARGGYGSGKLLDGIDYAAFRTDPKTLVGYSDITALNLALAAHGVISYSGIMATSGDGFGENTLDPFSEASFFQAVRQENFVFAQPDDAPLTVHRGGTSVAGRLVPVCLSLLESLASTKYVPDLTGALLLIEDVTEELYAVDRALTQLRLSGVLGKLNGLLIGSFNGWKDERDEILAQHVPRLALELTPESVAVVSGFVYGHIPRRFTLPMGAQATVDCDTGQLFIARP
ncbi:MAG: LD-carboxypeptidase [Armatimonadetes bacterium]|nr:LD-carboxypeptidase [Armatimonadota bacterium]